MPTPEENFKLSSRNISNRVMFELFGDLMLNVDNLIALINIKGVDYTHEDGNALDLTRKSLSALKRMAGWPPYSPIEEKYKTAR